MARHDASDNVNPPIRRLHERLVYRNRFAAIYDDPVVFAGGNEGTYLRIVESGGKPGVAMLPLCGSQIALVQTYRYAVESLEWGVPRGFAQDADPIISARAELTEELGRQPDELLPIGIISPNSGLLAGQVHLFLARYATKAIEPKDGDEIIDVEWIGVRELFGRIARGDIADAFTLSAITCAAARGLIELG